ncbi:hypothetical protein NM3164_1153 [Neisseria meningitidis NM3164]|nr:putative membrane protein [Neisseria meningitidis]EOC58063.1 hypothetical protein NM271_1189 [Neisseria meningitidis NM271]EOC58399.1 hypothetical protein NM115_1170 [Neisseria meningitidis NM115]EOC64948.1 hypothetical protein NM3222_1179 [Neisseria meningitidis NM3222]EOC70279.1 hypothetical protein NM3144_1166 [Neisseria meningitidis NM3144]EOC70872.1 hypothetical protein NM3158_1209 [Neisseria meningitidis NM3158]EOC73201.1 hypothetical protein NM3164_1153 [Neisseria meningitidis NM316
MKGYAAFVIFIGGLIVLTYRTKALLFVGIFFTGYILYPINIGNIQIKLNFSFGIQMDISGMGLHVNRLEIIFKGLRKQKY